MADKLNRIRELPFVACLEDIRDILSEEQTSE